MESKHEEGSAGAPENTTSLVQNTVCGAQSSFKPATTAVLSRGISAGSRLEPSVTGITPSNLSGDSFLSRVLAKVLFVW